MWENTLLIIKADYMRNRKILLNYLLKRGFQIQGSRCLLFSPEQAAEFYKDRADDIDFMVLVILLSKGISEAFVLAKDNAVRSLVDIMCCHFGSSCEMDRFIHVTMCPHKAQREIRYIFPNYIHDPIYCPEHLKCCNDESIMRPLISQLYDIIKEDGGKSSNVPWKTKLAHELMSTHQSLAIITNISAYNPKGIDEATQTKETSFKMEDERYTLSETLSLSSFGLSASTSSCLSCSPFGDDDKYAKQFHRKTSLRDLIKAKTTPLELPSNSSSSTSSIKVIRRKVQRKERDEADALRDLIKAKTTPLELPSNSSSSTSSIKVIRRKVQRKERDKADALRFSLDVVDEEDILEQYEEEGLAKSLAENVEPDNYRLEHKSQFDIESESGAHSKFKRKLKSQPSIDLESGTKANTKSSLEMEVQFEPKHKSASDAQSELQTEPRSKIRLEGKTELEEEIQSEPKHVLRSELQSQPQPEFQPETKLEARSELVEGVPSGPKDISLSEVQSQPQIEFPPETSLEGNNEVVEDIQSDSEHELQPLKLEAKSQ